VEPSSESRMSRISSPGRPKTYRTPSFSRHWTMRSEAFMAAGLGDPDGLDVDELADAVLRQLAPVTGALDASERHARVGLDDAVDEHGARLDLRCQMLGAPAVLGPQRRAETKGRIVGQADGIALVLRADDGRHRSEGLLVEGRHALVYSGEQRRRI